MKLILRYLKRYKLLVLLNFISVFGFALTELGIPTVISMMVDDENSIITVLVGQDVDDEQKKLLKKALEEKFSDLDIDIVDGNQPVYPFLIGVE